MGGFGGLGEGSDAPVSGPMLLFPEILRFSAMLPCVFLPLAEVVSTMLNKDNDLSPVNIYKISKGITFIDFYPLAHIWSSHCGQRLKDLYLALSWADLTVETENPLHTWRWRVVPPRVQPEGWRTRDSDWS